MRTVVVYKFWTAYFVLAFVLQLFAGTFPMEFFAFPVNAAFLLFGTVAMWVVVCNEKSGPRFSRVLGAPATTFILLGVFTATCLVAGLTEYLRTDSWWFFMMLSALSGNLLFTIFRGLRRPRRHRLRFALTHIGLFVALAGGFAGAPDTHEWRFMARPGETVDKAFDASGRAVSLEHELQLVRFDIERDDNGLPLDYEAWVNVEDKSSVVRVNHPYRLSWCDDLYLYGCGDAECRSCILQIVRQPWKSVEFVGIVMLLCGSILLFAGKFSVRFEKERNAS